MRTVERVLLALLVFLVVCSLPTDSFSGFERRFAGTRSLGTGGALCSFGEDPWAFYFNPAHAGAAKELSIFYVPALFGVEEMKATGLAYRDHYAGLDLSAGIQTFGFDLYRESVLSLNVSLPVYDFLFVGVNANANHLFIQDYGTDFCMSADLGMRLFVSDHVSLAVGMTNLNSATMTQSRDRLPQIVTAGMAMQYDILNVSVEYYRELGFPSSLRIGAEYSPVKYLVIRAGSTSGTNTFNAGLSVRFLSFSLDYGAAFHQELGTTHSFGVSMSLSDIFKSDFDKILERRRAMAGE